MSLHNTLLEGIAAFEVFRQLGYSPEDIYFVPKTGDIPPTISLAVEKEGRRFVIALGPYPEGETPEEITRQWAELASQHNAGKIEGFEEIYYSSRARSNAAMLVMGLQAKGLYPIRRQENRNEEEA